MTEATAVKATKPEESKAPKVMTLEFVNGLQSTYGIPEGMVAALAQTFKELESASQVLAATDGDNVDAVAETQWRESGAPEVKQYETFLAQVAKVQEKLAELQAQADAIKEPGIAQYREAAKEYAAKNGATAHESYVRFKTGFTKILDMAFLMAGKTVPDSLPKLPGQKKAKASGGTGERESGGWRPKLAKATVDGVEVKPAKEGDPVTMADIKVAVGLSDGSVTSFSKGLLQRNNNNREVPVTGSGPLKVTVNDKEHVIVLFGRPDETPATVPSTVPPAA